MSCKPSKLFIATLLSSVFLAGCFPSRPMYWNDRGDLHYYLDQATSVEYPDVEVASLEEVKQAPRPITVIDPDFDSYQDMTLEQCVSVAMQNSKVLRGYGTPNLQGTRVAPGVDNLVNGPQAAGTFYNVAVRETEPGFIGTPGQISDPANILTNTALDVNQGVEAALADFDTQFTAGAFWSNNDEPRNTSPVGDFLNPIVFQQDTINWQAEFAKKTANGTQLFFRNTNQWIENNNPLVSDTPPGLQALDSFYRTAFEFEVRQPLLRGRGAFIQRMPIVVSRIGTDQEIANLEAQLQNMVTNVEIRYWDLHCAFRNLEAAKEGRNAALETWRIVYDQFDKGVDVNIQQVAQASEQYHFFDAQVIDSYNNLLTAESGMRWLLGLATTDGRIIRPIDPATSAPVEFDWCATLNEALTYRPELRQQRWEVKKRQLAVAYSKNSLLPELNVTALYRWLGLGNRYGTGEDSPLNFPNASSGALNDLYGGEFQEFSLGVDYRIPIGLRRELSNVRNAQLKLARDVARTEDMELDVTREISEAIRALDANRRIMQSAFNRWKDTEIEKQHFEEIVELGLETLDVALDAQRRKTQAAAAFYSALCEYNKVIALIHRRKGTILSYNGIHFAEGSWAGKAYQDASENARRRGAGREINYGWTRPQVISSGQDYPPNGNVGTQGSTYVPPVQTPVQQPYNTVTQPVSAPYYDGGNVIGQPTDYYQGEIINGGIQGAPIQNTFPQNVIPQNVVPQNGFPGTINGSTSRNAVPRNRVSQANQRSTRLSQSSQAVVPTFVQQVNYDEPVQQRTVSNKQRKPRKKQVRTIQAAPVEHANVGSAKRLPTRATAQQAVPVQAPQRQTASGRPLNWEEFGLTRPAHGQPRTEAAIR